MWGVDPKMLCRKHLLGEHVEMHMFAGCVIKQKNLDGYIKKGLVELDHIGARHDLLVEEMTRRGYRHRSAFPTDAYNAVYSTGHYDSLIGKVNIFDNERELINRCIDCRKNINNLGFKPDIVD
jgi:hypothetical protein